LRTHSRFFRLTATTAIVGLTFGTLLPEISFAQTLPPLAPPAASVTPEAQTTADPPTRVGRLSRLVGQVSFHGIGADHWDAASLNFPVTSGDSFWTQPSASADLGVTNNRVTMDQSTELDVATLDDHSFVGTVPQGQIYLRLLSLAPGETYTITTPRGVVAITAPGRYEIAAGDTQNPTRITVVQGAAQVSGSNLNLQVAANQTVLITGTDPFQTQVVPAQRDQFLTGQLSRERPAVIAGGVTAPAVVEQMTGGEDLSQYGTWQQSPQYGQVWYPQVAAGYVPYRNGHWAFVQPWGWTWIDAAPWGFAPFHYGRWVDYGGRWGWAPGGGVDVAVGSPGYYAPVYAPALVTFLGIAAGVAVGAALAGGFGGNVGWCPLGWQEPYHPWYRTSPNYVRNVNVTSVRNVTNITTINNNTTTINNFTNRAGATMVPASAMAMSRPINAVARPIPAAQFADARPVIGRDPIAPTTATAGVTPRVAQQLHLAAPPPGAGAVPRPQAPGPVIRAQAAAPNERPALETNGRPPAPGATPGAAPVAGAATPTGRPALETTGRPVAPGAAPGVPATAEHAPGPPIEPRGTAAAPNTTPALRTPAQEAHPTVQAPGGAPAGTTEHTAGAPNEAHPGPTPQAQLREAPHEATQAVQPHEATQAVQPHVATPAVQAHEATPAVHPQVAPPQVHQPAAAPRVVQEARPAAPQVHAPAAAPRVQEQARPAMPVAVPRPAPAPRPQPQPQAHSAPTPHPQPHPAPQEHRQQSGQRGGGGREPHRG
jgi:hypothetical protein